VSEIGYAVADHPVSYYVIYTIEATHDCWYNDMDSVVNGAIDELVENGKLTITEDFELEKSYSDFDTDEEWEQYLRDQDDGIMDLDLSIFQGHRKYVGILSPSELEALLREELFPVGTCQTMGSLTDIGWLPAVNFEFENPDVFEGMYVSPIFPDPAMDVDDVVHEAAQHEFDRQLMKPLLDFMERENEADALESILPTVFKFNFNQTAWC